MNEKQVLLESQNLAGTREYSRLSSVRRYCLRAEKVLKSHKSVKIRLVRTQAWGSGHPGFSPDWLSDFVQILQPWMELNGNNSFWTCLLRGFSGAFWGWCVAGGGSMQSALFNSRWRNGSKMWTVFCHPFSRRWIADQSLRIKSWLCCNLVNDFGETGTFHLMSLLVSKCALEPVGTNHPIHFSFSQWCIVGCVSVCTISCFNTVIPGHAAEVWLTQLPVCAFM